MEGMKIMQMKEGRWYKANIKECQKWKNSRNEKTAKKEKKLQIHRTVKIADMGK